MIFIDTDVLIDAIARLPAAMDFLDKLRDEGHDMATTSLNMAETLRGTPPHGEERHRTLRILRGLREVPFGPGAARRYGLLQYALDRAGRPVGAVDAMVAAVVLESGGRLVTRNRDDFERIPGLSILSPPN